MIAQGFGSDLDSLFDMLQKTGDWYLPAAAVLVVIAMLLAIGDQIFKARRDGAAGEELEDVSQISQDAMVSKTEGALAPRPDDVSQPDHKSRR